MTGRELFNKYVAVGLCSDGVYEWEKLSVALQGRWNRLAEYAHGANAEIPPSIQKFEDRS